eukprot:scaffold82192_cov63-Phaeocystis_antarctica.AAC.1
MAILTVAILTMAILAVAMLTVPYSLRLYLLWQVRPLPPSLPSILTVAILTVAILTVAILTVALFTARLLQSLLAAACQPPKRKGLDRDEDAAVPAALRLALREVELVVCGSRCARSIASGGCNPMPARLQPYASEAAIPLLTGCNLMPQRLLPLSSEAATLCVR